MKNPLSVTCSDAKIVSISQDIGEKIPTLAYFYRNGIMTETLPYRSLILEKIIEIIRATDEGYPIFNFPTAQEIEEKEKEKEDLAFKILTTREQALKQDPLQTKLTHLNEVQELLATITDEQLRNIKKDENNPVTRFINTNEILKNATKKAIEQELNSQISRISYTLEPKKKEATKKLNSLLEDRIRLEKAEKLKKNLLSSAQVIGTETDYQLKNKSNYAYFLLGKEKRKKLIELLKDFSLKDYITLIQLANYLGLEALTQTLGLLLPKLKITMNDILNPEIISQTINSNIIQFLTITLQKKISLTSQPLSFCFNASDSTIEARTTRGRAVCGLSSGRCTDEETPSKIFSIESSHDGKLIAYSQHDYIALKETRAFYNPFTLTKYLYRSLGGNIYSIAFSPDSRRIAGVSNKGELLIWNIGTKTPIRTKCGNDILLSVSFSPDGSLVVTGGNKGMIEIWNIITEKCVQTITEADSIILSTAFSPDSTTIASTALDKKNGEIAIKLWDSHTGLEKDTLMKTSAVNANMSREQIENELNNMMAKSKPSISFSPDGTLLAANWNSTVALFDTEKKTCFVVASEKNDNAGPVCFSRDGKLLAAPFFDGSYINVWNIDNPKISLQQHLFMIYYRTKKGKVDPSLISVYNTLPKTVKMSIYQQLSEIDQKTAYYKPGSSYSWWIAGALAAATGAYAAWRYFSNRKAPSINASASN
jgi:WD40 repeat protein